MVMWRDFAVSRLWDLYSREQVEGFEKLYIIKSIAKAVV